MTIQKYIDKLEEDLEQLDRRILEAEAKLEELVAERQEILNDLEMLYGNGQPE